MVYSRDVVLVYKSRLLRRDFYHCIPPSQSLFFRVIYRFPAHSFAVSVFLYSFSLFIHLVNLISKTLTPPFKMKLEDQVVLITGSTRGLGLAIAEAFHREGAKVVLNCVSRPSFRIAALPDSLDIDATKVAPWRKSESGLVVQADVTDKDEVSLEGVVMVQWLH